MISESGAVAREQVADTPLPGPGDGQNIAILHCLAPAQFGGLERVVASLAVGQRDRGHAVHVAAVLDGNAPPPSFLDTLRAAGVMVHELVLPARAYALEFRRLTALIRELRPDVVHTHGYRADVIDGWAALRCGIPAVSTVHGFTGNGWKNRLYEWIQRHAYRFYPAVVAVSAAQVAQLVSAGASRDRIRVIPNAWVPRPDVLGRSQARRVLGIDDRSFVIGWVGRVQREKGPDVLIHALAELNLPDDAAVSVIGAGSMTPLLQRTAEASGWADRIRWHGPHPRADTLFSAFDVFVLSSRTEGTPIVLFEAMAAGVPIVAASVGGVPDVLTGREALLVAPEQPHALAAAIASVHRDPEAARTRALAARDRLRHAYDAAAWLDRYQDVYRSVCRTAGKRKIA